MDVAAAGIAVMAAVTRDVVPGDPLARVALAQGLFYLLGGLWPLVSLGTFLRVTGPKTDLWPVKTVGAMILVAAVPLLLAAARGYVPAEVALLGAASAAALAAVDVVYVAGHVIGPVYLLDAAVEAGLVVWWAAAAVASTV